MAGDYAKKNALMTLSESYPTPEAYVSGLLMPPVRERGAIALATGGAPGRCPMAAERARAGSSPSHGAGDAASQPTCEFQDFCNHLYATEPTCYCMAAWKRPTAIAFPVFA